jgi:hypothetical protein
VHETIAARRNVDVVDEHAVEPHRVDEYVVAHQLQFGVSGRDVRTREDDVAIGVAADRQLVIEAVFPDSRRAKVVNMNEHCHTSYFSPADRG